MISSRSSDYVHLRVLAFLPSGLKISPADLRQTSSGLALLPRFPSTGTAPLVCSFLSDWEKDGSRFDLVVTSLTTPWHQHQHHPQGRARHQEKNRTSPTSLHLNPRIMSRSAADATRFTATGPYASSKPGAPGSGAPYKLPSFMSKNNNTSNTSKSGSNPSQGPAGGPQETPKQKVERLRAQAKASRMAQSTSRFDRFVDAGREVANKAHKVMVYSLITASGMSSYLPVDVPLVR